MGFDFDGTVSDRRGFTCGPTHYPQYAHAPSVLRDYHAGGAALFIATNESITHRGHLGGNQSGVASTPRLQRG